MRSNEILNLIASLRGNLEKVKFFVYNNVDINARECFGDNVVSLGIYVK
jgi:hypothetical protein